MPAEPSSLKELFLAVLAVPPAERAAWLDKNCGHDAELRRRVELMLAAHDTPQSLLDNLAPATISPAAPTADFAGPISEQADTVIGPYKLLQQIGEGGMGTVFMAEQTHPVQRKVALKLIKAGMDSRQVIARFEAERQALALMDHPNIAKVFDAGTTDAGRPYFVMELVKGVPITKYCDDHRLTTRERLELFMPVCQAVQHAHQKGIIHRDVKPSNVMVCIYDGKPVPKVIDFGVAKATGSKLTERTLYTEFGAIVGTFEYMSPEQAQLDQLDIDTRSDIYSLGVLLYELLTGSTPLERKRMKEVAILELLRLVREEEAPKPSTRLSTAEGLPSIAANRGTEPKKLTGLIRGELDWIVLKALEKDRNRRYETANGFAADVQRYLADETVAACPPSAIYRLRKFARRNKGPVMAAGLVALALVAGVVGTSLGLFKARQERGTALAQRDRAEDAEKHATEEAAKAQAVTQFLIYDLLGQADVDYQPAASRDPNVKVRTLLDRAAGSIEGKFPDMPLVEAAIERVLGVTYKILGLGPEAQRHLERSVRLLTAKLAADHPETLRVRYNLATVYKERGKFAEAESMLRVILQAQTEQIGPTAPDTLSTKATLGRVYYDKGKYPEAVATLRECLEDATRQVGPDDPLILSIKQTLGVVYMLQGKPDLAEQFFNEAVQGYTTKFGAEYRQTLISNTGLGWLYIRQGKLKDAEILLKKTLAVLTKTLGADNPETLNCKHNLTMAYMGMREDAEAERLLKEIIAARTQHQGANHRDTLAGKINLAKIYERMQRAADAERLLKEVIAAAMATLGPSHPETCDVKYRLAGLLSKDPGRRAETLEFFRAEIALYEKLTADFPGDPGYRLEQAKWHSDMGQLFRDLGKWTESLGAYRAALALHEKLAAEFPAVPLYRISLGGDCCNLGHVILDSGKPAESLDWFARASTSLEPVLIEKDPWLPTARFFLRNAHWGRASALDKLNRPAEALAEWGKAVELSEPAQRPTLRARRADSRVRAGRVADAVAEIDELITLKGLNNTALYDFACVFALASAKDKVNQTEYAQRAVALLRQAVQMGYKDVAHMKRDTDLDPLRGREDFQKLLAELQEGKK